MQTWTTVADKAAWGDGPWVNEPDKAQWVDPATGLTCLAKRSGTSGSWCGYVGVHAGHLLHGQGYSDGAQNLEVHGGLTYSGGCQEDERPIEQRVCHIPAPGEPDDMWWFGFDCAHYMDFSPAMAARMGSVGVPRGRLYDEKYRTLAYVKAECAALAKQLVDVQESPS